MLTKLEIENFRCFRALTVEPLKRINLICGKNNSGKTTLLEALCTLSNVGYGLIGLLEQVRPSLKNVEPNRAGAKIDANIPWLFYNKKDEHSAIKVTGWMETTPILREIWKQAREGPYAAHERSGWSTIGHGQWWATNAVEAGCKIAVFSTQSSSPEQDAWNFSRVSRKQRKDRIIAMMNQIEPRLREISPEQETSGAQPILYANVGLPEMIPVTHLGQGCGRLINIYAQILAEDANVLLIDEVENGLHYSVLQKVWEGLAAAVRETGVQIFATTHSWECILAANAAILDDADFQVIRLDRVGDEIKPTIMDKETISTAKEFDMEMR